MKYHTQFEKRLFLLINEPLHEKGYDVIRIRSSSIGRGYKNIQIMIDILNADRSVNVKDCKEARDLCMSYIFNRSESNDNSICSEHDSIEVSSPGIDRPLTSELDMKRNIGRYVKIHTANAIDNRRKFSGILNKVLDRKIELLIIDRCEDGNKNREFAIDQLIECQIDYFKDQEIKKENKKNEGVFI